MIHDIRLAAEELIDNCLRHAFRDDLEHEKASLQSPQGQEASESINIRFGANEELFALAVTDNGGSLARSTILQRIFNQISLAGLLDESGRGLFLVYTTADRLIQRLLRFREKRLVRYELPLAWPPLWWMIFVGVLSTEWVLRRRNQLR